MAADLAAHIIQDMPASPAVHSDVVHHTAAIRRKVYWHNVAAGPEEPRGFMQGVSWSLILHEIGGRDSHCAIINV